jgi:hypothetical protein
LIGEIGWSWWWVLAPFWIPWAIFGVFVVVGYLIFLVVQERKFNKRKKK